MRVIIAGIGNVMLGDDGIGPYVARRLAAEYDFDRSVRVLDLGMPGLGLIAHLLACDLMIVVDAVQNGAAAGTVTRFAKDELCQAVPPRIDPHSPALTASLMLAELSGEPPTEVLAFGVTGERYEPSRPMSDAVRAAAPATMDAILRELATRGIAFQKKPAPTPLDLWWECPTARGAGR